MYKYGGEPSLVDLVKAFACLLERFETVYIFIDAIDESSPREDLLKALRDFVRDSRFKSLQIIASSREYLDIERMMAKFFRFCVNGQPMRRGGYKMPCSINPPV